MSTTIDRNDLRASVEAASGGAMTVLYTQKGQPSYMFKQARFNLEDCAEGVGTGVDPMFIMDGVEKDHRYIGAFPGTIRNGELISLPGVDPAASITHDQAVAYARANGPGWGIATNADYAGIARWCLANGFLPRGNTNYGRHHEQKFETATRQDSIAPGVSSGNARTLTGSGPQSWRHNNTPYGIADLCGNILEWSPGLRLVDGEIQVIKDNDAAMSNIDLSAASTLWRAIDGETGALVAPGSSNTVKLASSGTANYTIVVSSGQAFEGMTNPGGKPVSEQALATLRRVGIYPVEGDLEGAGIWYNLEGERLPRRGGDWRSGGRAGVFALSLINDRSNSSTNLGARPAFAV